MKGKTFQAKEERERHWLRAWKRPAVLGSSPAVLISHQNVGEFLGYLKFWFLIWKIKTITGYRDFVTIT